MPVCPRRSHGGLRVALAAVLVSALNADWGVGGAGSSAAIQTGEPSPQERAEFLVTTIADAGEGSLRQAILDATAGGRPARIAFDSEDGPFGDPQTIALDADLPELTGDILIDGYISDRLWRPSGVTISGESRHRVLRVGDGATAKIRSLTITQGAADEGAGVMNRGDLVVEAVTFLANSATQRGGAVASPAGHVEIINSTFAENRAGEAGGGLAVLGGSATVTNCTFSGNHSERGGGLFSSVSLLLRNTILANSPSGGDCMSEGGVEPESTQNLIEESDGCGTPFTIADPKLLSLDRYNGPTATFPLDSASPALNWGDNAAALDEHGQPLVWDQRGNGDPRYVAGITDIGAFESQYLVSLVVDTLSDEDLRACTRALPGDCSLRGAVTLANASPRHDRIAFDDQLFAELRTIVLEQPLPHVTAALILDAGDTAGVEIRALTACPVLRQADEVEVELVALSLACR